MKTLNNFDQAYLNKLLGVESLPPKYYAKLDDFKSFLVNNQEDFMTVSELEDACNLAHIDNDVIELLKGALSTINNSFDAKLTCYYFYYITYIAFYSTENQLFLATKASSMPDYVLHCFTLLAPLRWRYNEAKNRNIPDSYINHQFGDITRHVNRWMRNKESDGVIRWDTITAYLEIFPIHTLSLEPFSNVVGWHGFVNSKGQKLILMGENRVIRKDGQIDGVNKISNPWFTTEYHEDDSFYIGNPVHPYGYVENKIVKLDKKEWSKIPKDNEWFLEFHVSSHNPYNIDDFQKSLYEGIEFFKKYYPERKFVAIRGFSWLFSPQLKYFLDENKGNISRIKKCGYTVPASSGESNVFNFVFHNPNIKVEDMPETTSLYRGIKQYELNGGRINCGEMMFFLDDIDHMKDNVYMESYDKIIKNL